MSTPFISIVMPTRDRPELLQHSVRSALEQRFDTSAFEVVVSDNSTDDRTKALVKEIASPNLKYATTGGGLNMPDSWEFAASQASGRYLTFLCDDDALVGSTLEKLADALAGDPEAELVIWGHAEYYHPDWPEPWNRNRLVLPSYSGDAVQEASDDALRRLFSFDFARLPKMLNSACSNALAQRIRERAGRLFLPTSPDYSFMAASLAVTTSVLYLDTPLQIAGASKHSIGMASMRGGSNATRAFFSEFNADPAEMHPDAPLVPSATISSIFQSIVNVSRSGVLTKQYEPSLPRYFALLYSELRGWEAAGVDVKEPIHSLTKRLSLESGSWATDLLARIRAETSRRRLRHWLATHKRMARLERRIRSSASVNHETTLSGDENSFTDILECSRLLDSIVGNRD